MDDHEKGMQDNHRKMLNIGFFNDYYRETLKGGSGDSALKDKGYFAGNMYNCEIGGECMKNTNRYSYVDQSINYVECHDNATTFDKFAISNGDEPLETRKKRQLMLNVALILSQGIPFIHCGQEFYRSKDGLGNTYNTLDHINAVNWSLVDENQEDIETLKQMIQLRKENGGFKYETIKEVNQQLREKNDDLEKLKIDYSLKEKMIKDIQKINQQLEKDEDTYQRYLDLYNLASGKNNARVSIERYVLATYFENMLIYANVIMKQLSQGRYQLLRKDDAGKGRSQQGLELDVFDQESGNIRSIKTLSGGESFKAALSLALGLSRMVQDYAGGIELNTLFIDEGFGSLDSQSLDQAMNCLMELHHENKLIGIISHVSDLKDRIERQLVVERKQKQRVIQMI